MRTGRRRGSACADCCRPPNMNENHLVAFAVDILTDIYKSRFLIISLSNLK